MPDTIFTKIIAGHIPCHKLFEDAHVFAFLDIAPLAPGHTLLIPKESKPTLDQLSDESAAALGRALPPLCRAIMHATNCNDYNVLQNNGRIANQLVPHVHFHIIPKPSTTQGLGIHWPSGKLDQQTGASLAQQITTALNQRPH